CLALAILALNAADSPAFAIAGLVIPGVTLTVLSRTCCRVPRFWPREFFPLFYAVHLAVIGLMVM
ncbi:conjugal transfer protein, partial [Escherichia coli]|nr:conjugal transfer protein [Escherichia coli]